MKENDKENGIAGTVKGFEDLRVYRQAYKASIDIHRQTLTFPQFEEHELGRQIRRATKSIVFNVVEGYGKRSSLAEFKRFIVMAIGSCDEVKSQLEYCKDLGYMSMEEYESYKTEYNIIGKMLYQMYKNWQ